MLHCDSTAKDLLEAALTCVARGWRVVPLHGIVAGRCTCGRADCSSPGKHPLPRRWPEAATTDPNTVHQWWRRLPRANIGLVTGANSGLLVLDVDPRYGGDLVLRELEERYGPLPETAEAITGGGGRHIYFRHPGGHVGTTTLAPGLELKAEGALVVAPPSTHASGRHYYWELAHHPDDVPLATPPAWLLQLAESRGRSTRLDPRNLRQHVGGPIVEGQRNTTLTRIVGHLLAKRVDPYVVLEIAHAINRARCVPPLDDSEVFRIVESVGRCEARKRGLLRGGGEHVA